MNNVDVIVVNVSGVGDVDVIVVSVSDVDVIVISVSDFDVIIVRCYYCVMLLLLTSVMLM